MEIYIEHAFCPFFLLITHSIYFSSGSDNKVVIWNVGTGEALLAFNLPDLVYSGCWNWDGSEVLFTCKDRKIRRVDPRYVLVKQPYIKK